MAYKKVQLVNLSKSKRSTPSNQPHIRLEYRHLDANQRVRQAALDHSNNGECWWIYKHIINSISKNKEGY